MYGEVPTMYSRKKVLVLDCRENKEGSDENALLQIHLKTVCEEVNFVSPGNKFGVPMLKKQKLLKL